MPDLKTNYMGLTLKNPIIVASSGLTKNTKKIKECETAGAGAVVLKSLFEEVIAKDDEVFGEAVASHPEAYEYLKSELHLQYGPDDYCELIREAKKEVDIPIIASINCMSSKWWTNFSKKIESAGADALELNVFTMATDTNIDAHDIEKNYYAILEKVKAAVDIPISMKISNNFSSLPAFTDQMAKRGLDALVMFNRFAEPDIDIEKLELKTTFTFSTKDELNRLLRWVAILSGQIDTPISATTGINSAEGIIKMLLAGATTVQLASMLYKKGVEEIAGLLDSVQTWMENHNFKNIDQFRGRLSFTEATKADIYLRAQFMEKIRGIE